MGNCKPTCCSNVEYNPRRSTMDRKSKDSQQQFYDDQSNVEPKSVSDTNSDCSQLQYYGNTDGGFTIIQKMSSNHAMSLPIHYSNNICNIQIKDTLSSHQYKPELSPELSYSYCATEPMMDAPTFDSNFTE
eukprot:403426_1